MRKRSYGEPSVSARFEALPWFFFAVVLALCLYGLLWVYSATRYLETNKPMLVQGVAVLLGLMGMFCIALLDFQKYRKKLSVGLFALSIVLLLATLILGRGEGNRNWIDLPVIGISVQPSEFVKLGFICSLAAHLSFISNKRNHPLSVLTLLGHGGVIIVLVVLQGDLGSALVFLFVFACMLLAGGISLWYFLAAAVTVGAISPFLWNMLSTYQRQRILVGFHPESDARGYGYQVLCSKSAIASGGLLGQGYLHGAVSQSTRDSALPARHTDMIFAVVGEEGGFVAVMVYLVLLCLLLVLIFRAARRAEENRQMLLLVGIGAVLVFQSVENIGMCVGLLPVVGITLPFLSYGGSSMLSLLWMMGAVWNVMRQCRAGKQRRLRIRR